MYSVEKDANTETSRNRGQKNVQDLNPDHIIVEIDQLEARVRDSRRLLQQERDSVLQLTQIKTRNEEEGKKLADEIIHLEVEERQLQERERFLLQACCSAEQSTCLLMQLETQTRTKLNEEINVTITKENELKRQLETYRIAAVKVQEGFDRQGDSMKIEKLRSEIAKKMDMLNLHQKQVDNKEEEKANFDNSKMKDIQAWVEFKKLCVGFSEEWLKWKGDNTFVEKLENDKASLETELYSSRFDNDSTCNITKEMPIVRNEPMNDNVQRPKYENKVYDCEEFGDNGSIKESESYVARDMDIGLPTEQDVVQLPVQPTPKTRNRQVKLGTSLLDGFSKHTLRKPMSISKDIKKSEFTLPKLPGLQSVKSKKEHSKLEANKFQQLCTENMPKLPELRCEEDNREQKIAAKIAALPVENKQKLNKLEANKLQQLCRENDTENGLSELQSMQKTPRKIVQNAPVLKVSSQKKSLKLGMTLELPKFTEKRCLKQFDKQGINENVHNAGNISKSKTIQGEVDLNSEATIGKKNNVVGSPMFSTSKKSDTKSFHSPLETALPNVNVLKEKYNVDKSNMVPGSANSQNINISVAKMAQRGNLATHLKSMKVLGNISPGTAFCDTKRNEKLQELLASPEPSPETRSMFMMPMKNDRKPDKMSITNKIKTNSKQSQIKTGVPQMNILMDKANADNSSRISETSNSLSRNVSATSLAQSGNIKTPPVINKMHTNVIPATALCDIKRTEKLNMLTPSPEPNSVIKSKLMFDHGIMQNHHKPDRKANLIKTNPEAQQRGDKGDHILSPMRSHIQDVDLKNKVSENNTKISHKLKISSNEDDAGHQRKSDSIFDTGKSSFDFTDQDKNKKDGKKVSDNQSMFSIEESASNKNKSDNIFDVGKSSFNFTDKADDNEFSMNFDGSTNSNFQFANFDFGDDENLENNDNSFTFNFGETSEESKKEDNNFSLF